MRQREQQRNRQHTPGQGQEQQYLQPGQGTIIHQNWGHTNDLAKFAEQYQAGTYIVSVGNGKQTFDYCMTIEEFIENGQPIGRITNLFPMKSLKSSAAFRVELFSDDVLRRARPATQGNLTQDQQLWDREQQLNRRFAPAGSLA